MKENYRLLQVLGRGSFGKVVKAVSPTGTLVAIKMIELDIDGNTENIMKEVSLLRSVHSPYITQLFDVKVNDTTLWLCMEYCGAGSCFDLIRVRGCLPEDAAIYILKQLFLALEHIHALKIIHRDVKSPNILITSSCTVKLGDFGVGAQMTNTCPQKNTLMGTPYWMAPEIITQNLYGTAVDIWSAGIVGIELVTGNVPHGDVAPTTAMMRIADGPPPKLGRRVIGQNVLISPTFVRTVNECLEKSPQLRTTAREVTQTRWFEVLRPPRSFVLLINECGLANGGNAKGVIVHPTVSGGSPDDAARGWRFTGAGESPHERAHVVQAVQAVPHLHGGRSSPTVIVNRPLSPVSPGGLNEGKQPRAQPKLSQWFRAYIEPTFDQVEKRSKKKEAQLKIERVHQMFARLDVEFPGFSQAMVEEFAARLKKYPC